MYLSLSDVQMAPAGIKTRFVGIQWYQEAFTLDTTFPLSLLDTMKFVLLSTPMIVVAALLLHGGSGTAVLWSAPKSHRPQGRFP